MRISPLILVPFAAPIIFSCQEKQKQQRPNILFIMTDDHTTQAMSCYGGNLINTPGMDRLAEEGMRFNNCYATNALSGPSRACILTGKFGHINGFTDNAGAFDSSQQTFPQLLSESGYQTAIIGKWHLISEPQHFDYWSILSGQEEQGDYYNPDFIENGVHIQEEGYVSHVITKKAIDYIASRDKSKPFCLMVHHKAPHRNWMPAPEHIGEYANTVFPEPANLFDDYQNRGRAAKEQDLSISNSITEDWDLKLLSREKLLQDTTNRLSKVYRRMQPQAQARWDSVYAKRAAEYYGVKRTEKEMISWKYQQYMQDYLATVLSVDESISELMEYLEQIGELDNTLIVYTSDQGFFLGEHGWFDKRFMYEECQRMPLLMRYPPLLQPQSQSNAVCMNIDFAPTFLALAGVDIPDDIQGRSLLPIMENNGVVPKEWDQVAYYHYYEYPAEHSVKRHYGIRTDRYKLIHFYNDIDEWEMYDMQADPREMKNVYNNPSYSAQRDSLHLLLKQTQEKYKDADPQEKEIVLYRGDRRLFNRQTSSHK